MNGKGDKRRPMDNAKFRDHFDEINWHKPVICQGCGWEIDPEVCHCGDEIKRHDIYGGHSPIPMGCTCGYNDAAKMRNPNFKR